MATRAISWIRKSSLVNSLTQASFSSHSSSAVKQAQSSFPSAFRVSARDVTSPAIRSVISHGPSIGATQLSQSLCYSSTSGMFTNVNIRFTKQRRNRGEMKGESDNRICFGEYGLQVLEPAWITSKQILAGQLAIKRTLGGRKYRGKSLIRVFPHKPVSLRPAETRMGRGKGSTAYWVAGVTAGRIIYELNGVPEGNARRAILIAASKIPARTRMVKF